MPEVAHVSVMKKLINSPQNVVLEELEGMEAAHGDRLRISYEPAYIARKDAPIKGKVGLVSGGGSGHEPMHGGYVGKGMLDAACPGAVFTSPTPDQMYEASKAVHGGAGILHIVKNYTGDIMNFELAQDMLRADGIQVNSVLTDDDVAVQNSLYTAGRRGVGLTVLMEKLLGAAAEKGMSLADLTTLGGEIRQTGRSMGMALTPCTVPHAGKPSFELPDDEIELGIGIHGEPGRYRVKMASADEITDKLMEPILTDLPFKSGDNVLLFVNGMGGTPLIELYIVYRKAAQIAKAHGIKVVRNLVGSYITSLEMAGTSITLLRMNDRLCQLWDAPVDTPGLRWGI
jgi:dihydroxyacetone kinase-like protein